MPSPSLEPSPTAIPFDPPVRRRLIAGLLVILCPPLTGFLAMLVMGSWAELDYVRGTGFALVDADHSWAMAVLNSAVDGARAGAVLVPLVLPITWTANAWARRFLEDADVRATAPNAGRFVRWVARSPWGGLWQGVRAGAIAFAIWILIVGLCTAGLGFLALPVGTGMVPAVAICVTLGRWIAERCNLKGRPRPSPPRS